MKKMAIILLECAALVLTTACGEKLDCRHKAKECAAGFTCEQSKQDRWICEKSVQASDESVPVVSKENKQKPPGPPKEKTVPCPTHPRCLKKAMECRCNNKKQLVAQSLDKNGDGKIDERAVYRYNQENFLTFVLVDEGADGTVDVKHEYGYLGKGIPRYWEIIRVSKDASKKENSRLDYQYNSQGHLVEETYDMGMDGNVDRRCIYTPPCPGPFPNSSCKPICSAAKSAPTEDLEMETG